MFASRRKSPLWPKVVEVIILGPTAASYRGGRRQLLIIFSAQTRFSRKCFLFLSDEGWHLKLGSICSNEICICEVFNWILFDTFLKMLNVLCVV